MFCKKCEVEVPSEKFLHHLRLYHDKETDLDFCCPGCEAKFSTVPTFHKHWYKVHHVKKPKRLSSEASCSKESSEEDIEPPPKKQCCDNNTGTSFTGDVDNQSEGTTKSDLCEIRIEKDRVRQSIVGVEEHSDNSASVCEKSPVLEQESSVNMKAASLVLKLRENCHAPIQAVQDIVRETQELFFESLKQVTSQIDMKLKEKNLSLNDIVNVPDLIQSKSDIFKGLKTEHQQHKYFQKTLNIVPPERRPLGREFKKARRKGRSAMSTVLVCEEFLFVPITSTMERLLNHPDYKYLVENGSVSQNSKYLDSYMQGTRAKNNTVLRDHPDALRFVLYYDDLEACAPLKSRAGKHKLGAFYLYLDNIHPKYRSNLSLITLVALVNANLIKDKKYGIDSVLECIVQDLKKFEEGFVLPDGTRIYGTLIAFIGDNLGSHAVGGFKEGFTAHRCCRFCLVTYEQLKSMTKEDISLLRDEKTHDEQCSQIQTEKGKNETLSTKYGVNRYSVLNKLKTYHVVGGLPPDIMHDFWEGALPLTVKRFLRYILYEAKEKKFTLDWLNQSIRDFDYDYAETSDKPSEIKREHIMSDESVSLHQSASQMLLLATILPLIIGPFLSFEDEHYSNFLECLEIGRLILTSEITEWMVVYLQETIESYLLGFLSLYGPLIPKQHHLLHYPSKILEMGSLLNYNCMRLEAKHKYFKRLVNILGSYKNIPFTLAKKHQMTQAADWMKSFRKTPVFGPQISLYIENSPYATLLPFEKVVVANWLQYEGNKFVPERCFICVGVDENDLPIFAKVLKIVIQPKLLLVCSRVKTVMCSVNLAAYEIEVLSELCLHTPEDMCIHSVLHSHNVKSSLYIFLKWCVGGSVL